MNHVVRGAETAASTIVNLSSPGNMTTSALTSLQQIVDNKDRLNRAGINQKDIFTPQVITDIHQKEALDELLSSVGASNEQHHFEVGDGRTIRICDYCHDCLERGVPISLADYLMLSQHTALLNRDPVVETTLHNSTSVKVFTSTFSTPSDTHKIIIRIDPAYFEERPEGSPRNAIRHGFNELARVLKCQKKLMHLEIHGNSTNGTLFAGLRDVFQCESLETLHVSGIPCFLQVENIAIKCRRLRVVTLQVLVNTEHAVSNIEALMRSNPCLTSVKCGIDPIS